MGYVDAEGYLYFADRRSDMIVTGGENVFAAEVEMVLKKHPKVVDAVVIGLPDPDWGHRIHAIVETNGPVGNKDLIRFALNYLPPYKIPKSIELVDHIPVNENGKVVRSKLVEESLAKGYRARSRNQLSHGFVPESLDRRMYSWKTTKII